MRYIFPRSIVTLLILILCLLTLDLRTHAAPKNMTRGQWVINGAFQQDQVLTTPTREKVQAGGSSQTGRTRSIKIQTLPSPPNIVAARPLIVSEFRLNGTNGANDEFIEIYNASNSAHTVNSSDGSASGYAVAASDGVVRVIIPQGTVIPARGHFLGCNSVGYSVTNYPSGNNGVDRHDRHLRRHLHGKHFERRRPGRRWAEPAPSAPGHRALLDREHRELQHGHEARRGGPHRRGQHALQGGDGRA